ncbi:MAG: hypothetical protein LIP09_00900 [Bacteroidales bacterium]|nr:hypothetical protein [Bacteroidales bacterium]
MTDELKINGESAWGKYGLFLADGALATLMAPPATKDPIQSECRTENGTRTAYADGVTEVASREFSLETCMLAKNMATFAANMAALTTTLLSGEVTITTKWQEGMAYRCRYVSSTTFNMYGLNGRIGAKLIIKFEEPNPANRGTD